MIFRMGERQNTCKILFYRHLWLKENFMSDTLSDNGLLPAEDLFYMIGGKERIKILDATYSMPGGQMSPFQGFLGRRIEGAQFFDIDAVADQAAPLAHTLPSPEYFASC